MAYARLVFPANTPVLRKLKDIAKVCTGVATSINQLEFITPTSSELISAESAGWTLADADSAFESNGVASKVEYRLYSNCVNSSKQKFCALKCFNPFNQVTLSGDKVITYPTTTSITGGLVVTAGTSVTNSSLTSEALFLRTALNGNTTNWSVTDNSSIDISANEFYISVSNRKLIIANTFSFNSISGILEFPETVNTAFYNNVPMVAFTARSPLQDAVSGGSVASPPTISAISNSIRVNGTSTSSGASATIFRLAALVDWFNSRDTIRSNRNITSTFFTDCLSIQPPLTLASDTLLAYPLQEMISVRSSMGEGIHNYSRLTETYITNRQPTTVTNGHEMTINNGASYVILTLGNSADSTNMRSICIKKA